MANLFKELAEKTKKKATDFTSFVLGTPEKQQAFKESTAEGLERAQEANRLFVEKMKEGFTPQRTFADPMQKAQERARYLNSPLGIISETVKGLPQATKKVATAIPEIFAPAITEFAKTTGGIFGEGLAYAVDPIVREQYKAGRTEILPTITKTEGKDVLKKTIAAGLETAVFKVLPATIKQLLLTRFGQGALEGIGFAIAEGLAKDKTSEQIIEQAKSYAKWGGAISVVAPYLIPILGAELKNVAPEVKKAFQGIVEETKGLKVGLSVEDVSKQIPKELEPLAQEARKYKSVEEFVKAQPPLYHGTRQPLKEGEGLFPLTDNPEIAKAYSRNITTGNRTLQDVPSLIEVDSGKVFTRNPNFTREASSRWYQDKNGNKIFQNEIEKRIRDGELSSEIITGSKVDTYYPTIKSSLDLTTKKGTDILASLEPKGKFSNAVIDDAKRGNFDWGKTTGAGMREKFNVEILPQLKELGYDAIQYSDDSPLGSFKTTAVFDTKSLKTKSQLTDFYNQAKAEVPVRMGEVVGDIGVPIPRTREEFERLPFEKQEQMFDSLPEVIQNQIIGFEPLEKFAGTPLETLAKKVAYGEIKIRVPKDIKTDVLETLGKGTYMRVFRQSDTLGTLDEFASDLGVSSSKLVEEIRGAILKRTEDAEKTLLAKNATRQYAFLQKQKSVKEAKDIIGNIVIEREKKSLGGSVLTRLKEKIGIKELKNTPKEKLVELLDDITELREGDSFLPRAQVESLRKYGVNETTTKREAANILGDVLNWRDRNSVFFNFFKTIDQKIEGVAGKDVEKMKNILTRPREKAVTAMVREEISLKKEMRDTLYGLGVKDGNSRALIMRYGEGRITLDELKNATPKWNEVVKANQWFRQKYDELLKSTNNVLRRFYSEDKLIPKRKDYYTHSQELGSTWSELTSRGDINPALEQISEFTRPNRRFNPFALFRKGGKEFVEDAAFAFESYLTPILNNKHITESIVRTRAVADILAHKTLDSKNIGQFIFSLRDAADSLAGKTNPFDRALMNRAVGRQTIRIFKDLQTRLAKNRIVGSVGSAIMQISGIPTSVLRNNLIRTTKGLFSQAFSPLLGKNDPILKSEFMVRRYGEGGLRPGERIFEETALRQVVARGGKIISIPFQLIERNITGAIWRSSFDNAYSQGFRGAELMQKADEITASIVGSRALGEKALAFESGVLSLPLQFQLEVNTHAQLWSEEVFAKIFKEPTQAIRAAIETSVTLFLFNTLFEKTLGRTPLPDPIRAIAEASGMDTFMEKVGRIAGEGLSSVAGGQFIANLLPEETKKKYFGRSEVGIYPGGIPVVQAVSKDIGEMIQGKPGNFVYDFILPYGGGQLKKILEGIEGLDKMGSYNKAGKLQFPLNQNQWFNVLVFGKYSTSQAKEYFDKQRQPLSERQTVEYFLRTQNGENPQGAYDDITKERRQNEYKKEIVEELVEKIKANPQEGLVIIQLWKKRGVIDAKMEAEILENLRK